MRWTGWVTVALLGMAAGRADACPGCPSVSRSMTLQSVQVAGVVQTDLADSQGWHVTLADGSATGFHIRFFKTNQRCNGCNDAEERYAAKP